MIRHAGRASLLAAFFLLVSAATLAGCVTPSTLLINPDQGQVVRCAAQGWGYVGAPMAQQIEASCVKETGKGFMPGQSGNPSGKNRSGLAALVRSRTQNGEVLVELMYRIACGARFKTSRRAPDGIVREVRERPSASRDAEIGFELNLEDLGE